MYVTGEALTVSSDATTDIVLLFIVPVVAVIDPDVPPDTLVVVLEV